jgi:hypothetical protein
MRAPQFRLGDKVINAGRLAGYGYIWRVVEVHQGGLLTLLNIGPLVGKPEPMDSHIGGRFQRHSRDELQPLPPPGTPIQMGLI